MSNVLATAGTSFYSDVDTSFEYEADLGHYASLFLKPLSQHKSAFTKKELEVMCKDPLHSPRLIIYLIEFIKNM